MEKKKSKVKVKKDIILKQIKVFIIENNCEKKLIFLIPVHHKIYYYLL